MIDLSTKVCEARCCAGQYAAGYVTKKQKGRATDDDFIQLMLLHSYVEALQRYEKSLPLDGKGCGCGEGGKGDSCLSEQEVLFIIAQVSTICGGCTCNC